MLSWLSWLSSCPPRLHTRPRRCWRLWLLTRLHLLKLNGCRQPYHCIDIQLDLLSQHYIGALTGLHELVPLSWDEPVTLGDLLAIKNLVLLSLVGLG